MIQVKYNYEERGQKVLVLKSSIDNRDGIGKIKSRIGIECDAIAVNNDTDIFDLVKVQLKKGKIDCVLIDEAQFLSKTQVMEYAPWSMILSAMHGIWLKERF